MFESQKPAELVRDYCINTDDSFLAVILFYLVGGNMKTYKKLFKYVPELKHYAYISVFLSSLASVLAIMPYWFLWKFLNSLLVDGNLAIGEYYAFLIIGLMISYVIVYTLAVWVSHRLGFRLETNLRKIGIDHLMNASFSFFDLNQSGKIRKIIDDNAADTHSIVAHLIPDNAAVVITPLLVLGMTLAIEPRLFILTLIVIILAAYSIKKMGGNVEFMKLYQDSLERLNSETVEYVRGMQVIKIFRGTVQSFKSFYNAIIDYSKYVLQHSMSSRTPFVLFQVLLNIFATLAIPFAVVYINRGAESGMILSKLIFYGAISGILMAIFMKVMYLQTNMFLGSQAIDKLENLFEDMKVNKLDYGKDNKFENYNIEFNSVTFKYADTNVLDRLSFKLKENRTYALVGASGSGKSTIAKLLSGFYKINSGEICIGGKNISNYSEKALMDNIAFVFQNSKLFKTSIFENVKMGREDASYSEVMEALKLAKCENILEKFDTAENTLIGSKGVHLSGGEIQRIAIARAILKDANIIILDEASAAADPENEFEIQQAFSNLMKGKTVIMIAHRLSSIKNVDEILVISGGEIIERGKDEELMSGDTEYKRLQNIFSKANDWRIYD